MKVEDLERNPQTSEYYTPCHTYKIYYCAIDGFGSDCWVANPNKPGYEHLYSDTLSQVVAIIDERYPELSSAMFKALYWN